MSTGLIFKGADATSLAAVFQREGQRTSKVALREMRRVSKLVMQQSIRNSPVDWHGPHGRHSMPGHELELAHHIDEDYGDNRRLEATVWVGGWVDDVNVDLYATWIHEGVGWNDLGPASIAKAQADPRNKVGPHFLERALEDYEDAFDPLMDDLLQGLMS